MKVALVHEWLDGWGGSEQVLVELLTIFPDAELFALVDFLSPDDRRRLGGRTARTSFIQRLPAARKAFRNYLPLFPLAVERLDVSPFDLVVSCSHAVAKGVRTSPAQLHICLCYTPMRYAWDLREQYLRQVGLHRGPQGFAVRAVLDRLRRWDRASSARVDHFVAISRHVARRIRECYDRDSTVIYPPVTVPAPAITATRTKTYVTVSRLVPYKRVDLIVAAFRLLPDRELLVIGDGPELERVAAAAGPNVRLAGRLPDAERDRWLASARAFVFVAEEDFGIAPLEAQAMGTPVIAYARGGAAETVRGLDDAAPTGIFFAEQSAPSIAAAVRAFERHEGRITADACRANAERFSAARFRREFEAFVDARRRDFGSGPAAP